MRFLEVLGHGLGRKGGVVVAVAVAVAVADVGL